jgi:hypothetical protein
MQTKKQNEMISKKSTEVVSSWLWKKGRKGSWGSTSQSSEEMRESKGRKENAWQAREFPEDWQVAEW